MPTSSRRFNDRACGSYLPVPPVRSRADVGIRPYADGKIFRPEIKKLPPGKQEAVFTPGGLGPSLFSPEPSQQSLKENRGVSIPGPPTGTPLPQKAGQEEKTVQKERFYRGMMPMMTANSMHRMENTHT